MADKIVRASDASLIKRLGKKYFNQKFLSDMTDQEMQDMLNKPSSVFSNLKNIGAVAGERARRKSLLSKAYEDQIFRDKDKPKRERNLSVEIMVKAAKRLKKELDLRKKKEQTNAYGKRNLRE